MEGDSGSEFLCQCACRTNTPSLNLKVSHWNTKRISHNSRNFIQSAPTATMFSSMFSHHHDINQIRSTTPYPSQNTISTVVTFLNSTYHRAARDEIKALTSNIMPKQKKKDYKTTTKEHQCSLSSTTLQKHAPAEEATLARGAKPN